MQTLYQISLVAHIVGLTMLAGTTLVDYVISGQFWKQLAIDRSKGLTIHEAVSKFGVLFAIGGSLVVISGIVMMAITRGAFGEQLWFRIKFALVILIIVNGAMNGRKQVATLRKLLLDVSGTSVESALAKIKRNMKVYHLTQLVMFIAIFTLSVFKFN
ncbi:MAG TPA: hypothetical protein VIN08_28395 [Ohtaekwangia sp.]|uniref:hypothetical protein n=1 Tax=Ohtaekwangia sp. TaxID=2066019 RepID=UPI002F9242A3